MAVFDNIKGIGVASGFKLQAKSALDPRLVVATLDERNELVTGNGAYEGMSVYVKANKKTYQLQGTTNADWVDVTGEAAAVTGLETRVTNVETAVNDAKGTEDTLKARIDSVEGKIPTFEFSNGLTATGTEDANRQVIQVNYSDDFDLESSSNAIKASNLLYYKILKCLKLTTVESSTSAKSYELKIESDYANETIGTIDIPKDMVVSGGVVETYTAGDPNIPVDPSKTDGSKLAPGTYIVLTIANSTKDKLYIPADSLIEYVTAGTPATDDGVRITVSSDHKVTATLLDNAVTTTKIKDANVTAAKLAANAVETAKIKDGAVTSTKLASKAVTAAKIADATITETQLAKTVTDKLAKTDKIVDATEETAGLVTLAGANSSKTGYDIAASVGYVNDTVNPLGQMLGNEIETSTQRYETIMGIIHGTDDSALNVRLTKVEETASTAKSTADSKTKVIWVDKNGTIPTTAEANTLLFQIL